LWDFDLFRINFLQQFKEFLEKIDYFFLIKANYKEFNKKKKKFNLNKIILIISLKIFFYFLMIFNIKKNLPEFVILFLSILINLIHFLILIHYFILDILSNFHFLIHS
jgi:hypothetical protein